MAATPPPEPLDAEGRPLEVDQRVRHSAGGDVGTVTFVVAATAKEKAHVVVDWDTGPFHMVQFGDELTIVDPAATPPTQLDANGRPLKPGQRVTHYVDGDTGTVVALIPEEDTGRGDLPIRPAHVVVDWEGESGEAGHLGDELTILDANG